MNPAPPLPSSSTLASQRLVCHPASPCPWRLQLHASASPTRHPHLGACLQLSYTLQGDLSHLLVPKPTAPGPADGLWRHTCLEAFVGVAQATAYQEFNFSPSGQWAAYRFSSERLRDAEAEATQQAFEPSLAWQLSDTTLTLTARVPLSALPAPQAGAHWDVGLTAVIESLDGTLSYWALQHPCAQADFHHRGGWQRWRAWPTLQPLDTSP